MNISGYRIVDSLNIVFVLQFFSSFCLRSFGWFTPWVFRLSLKYSPFSFLSPRNNDDNPEGSVLPLYFSHVGHNNQNVLIQRQDIFSIL